MRTPTTYDTIRLADNEWGNQIMREIAERHFRLYPDCNFVNVIEHAGWHLGWHRSMECISTANDMAVMRDDRPRPTGFSGISLCREVIRPEIKEVSSLAQYAEWPVELAAAA